MRHCFLLLLSLLLPYVMTSGQERQVRFAIASDFHAPDVPDGKERLAAFISAAEAGNADFIIELGDFCRLDSASTVFRDMWNSFKGDGYHVIGNHDMDRYSPEEYVSGMGMPGRYYSFDKGDFHFIVLDGNNMLGKDGYIHYAYGNYYSSNSLNYIDAEQLDWLKEDLKSTDKKCLVFSHQSIDLMAGNGSEVRKIFEDENRRAGFRKVVMAFSGHNHSNYTVEIGGITYVQINSASYVWVGKPVATEKRFSAVINARYPLMEFSMMYTEPLYAIVTLTEEGADIDGRSAGFIPPTPDELGMPDSLGVFPLVSEIRDGHIGFRDSGLGVVFIGDSITEGAGLSEPGIDAPPARAAGRLAELLPDTRIYWSNQGTSGSTTADFLPSANRLFGDVTKAADSLIRVSGSPLVFSIMLGTNDSAESGPTGSPVSPVQYEKNLCEIIDSLMVRYPDCRIVLHRPLWYSPNTRNGAEYLRPGLKRLKSYSPALRRVVKRYSETAPGRVLPGDFKGFSEFRRNSSGYFSPEQGACGTFYLHPNHTGAEILGRLWADGIKDAVS